MIKKLLLVCGLFVATLDAAADEVAAKKIYAKEAAQTKAEQEVERRRAREKRVLEDLIPQLSYDNDVFTKTLLTASKKVGLPKRMEDYPVAWSGFKEFNFADPNLLNEKWDLQRSDKRLLGRLYAIDAERRTVSICDHEGAIVIVALDSPSLTLSDVERRIRCPLERHHMLHLCVFLSRVHDQFTDDEHRRIVQSALLMPSTLVDRHVFDIFRAGAIPRDSTPYRFIALYLNEFTRYRQHNQMTPGAISEKLAAAYQACLQGRLAGKTIEEALKSINDPLALKSLSRSAIIEASQYLGAR